MKQVFAQLAAAGLVLTAVANPAAATPVNLVANGSFESFGNGVFTGWANSGNSGINPNQFAVQQTTDSSTSGQYGDVTAPDPFTVSPTPAGTHAAYFVADQADYKLSQGLQLVVGQLYQTGFDLYVTPSGAGNSGSFTISDELTGTSSTTTLASASNTTLSPGAWTHYAATFKATSATETLAMHYVSGITPAVDVLLDGVYVTAAPGIAATAVPEPASLALFGLGLLGLWGMRRATIG